MKEKKKLRNKPSIYTLFYSKQIIVALQIWDGKRKRISIYGARDTGSGLVVTGGKRGQRR